MLHPPPQPAGDTGAAQAEPPQQDSPLPACRESKLPPCRLLTLSSEGTRRARDGDGRLGILGVSSQQWPATDRHQGEPRRTDRLHARAPAAGLSCRAPPGAPAAAPAVQLPAETRSQAGIACSSLPLGCSSPGPTPAARSSGLPPSRRRWPSKANAEQAGLVTAPPCTRQCWSLPCPHEHPPPPLPPQVITTPKKAHSKLRPTWKEDSQHRLTHKDSSENNFPTSFSLYCHKFLKLS